MDLWTFQIPIPVALAIVATIGYIFGRRSKAPSDDSAFRSRRELRRAQLVAAELEKIAWDLRKNLAKHHSSVSKFRDRVGKLNDDARKPVGRSSAARRRRSSSPPSTWPPRSPTPTTRSASRAPT